MTRAQGASTCLHLGYLVIKQPLKDVPFGLKCSSSFGVIFQSDKVVYLALEHLVIYVVPLPFWDLLCLQLLAESHHVPSPSGSRQRMVISEDCPGVLVRNPLS